MVPIAEDIFWPIFHHMGGSFLNIGFYDDSAVCGFHCVLHFTLGKCLLEAILILLESRCSVWSSILVITN